MCASTFRFWLPPAFTPGRMVPVLPWAPAKAGGTAATATTLLVRIQRASPLIPGKLPGNLPLRHGAVVPVLRAGNVRQPPVLALPPLVAVHLEEPEARVRIADGDEAVGVAHLDAERALHHARAGPVRRLRPAISLVVLA